MIRPGLILLSIALMVYSAAAETASPLHKHGGGGGGPPPSTLGEEFVGPFPNWINAHTGKRVDGTGATVCTAADNTGVADAAAAINSCLAALNSTTISVLYFPAGTYKIGSTITLSNQIYVQVIGQAPSQNCGSTGSAEAGTVCLIWSGSSGGTLFTVEGNAYSKFDRMTFNGNNLAAILVSEDFNGSTGNFDDDNEYADDVFTKATVVAFKCGLVAGCADIIMLRDSFINNNAGIWVGNQNALDVYVWYSFFQNNGYGITNYMPTPAGYLGAGNFHSFNSVYQASSVADIYILNPGTMNFSDNYSSGSASFIQNLSQSNATDAILVQRNTVVNTTSLLSITLKDLGPLVLLDNVIASDPSFTTGPVVETGMPSAFAPTSGDLFSMGNTFTVASPTGALYNGGHYHTISCSLPCVGDTTVSRGSLSPVAPTLPGVPPNLGRSITEVTVGGGAAAIASAITTACGTSGSPILGPHNVVHIQPGGYSVSSTLVVPASDCQIIGDGGNTVLTWAGAGGGGPVMQLLGPTKVTLRDFYFEGSHNSSAGLEVDSADQTGSRIYMESAILSSSNTNLFVDALDRTNVELHDFQHIYGTNAVPATGTSLVVTGGPSAAGGTWLGGATNILSGASTGDYITYNVSNGAHVGVRAIWNDGASGEITLGNVTGTFTTFTHAGSAVNLPLKTTPAYVFNNFQGTGALVSLRGQQGAYNMTGNGSGANMLGLGMIGASPSYFNNTSSPAVTTEFLNGLVYCVGSTPPDAPPCPNPNTGEGGVSIAEVPTTPVAAFLSTTLNQLRNTMVPTLPAPLANGITDARFYRLGVSDFTTGIHLKN